MYLTKKYLSVTAFAAASFAFSSIAHADVCDTPSKLGDLGNFAGEVITVAGSMEGKDEEMLVNTVSCFEKSNWCCGEIFRVKRLCGTYCC